jgi:membrane-bound lytic murein transglycosylase F
MDFQPHWRLMPRIRLYLPIQLFKLLLIFTLGGCDGRGPTIESLRAGGVLRVALVSGPHNYRVHPDELVGFDVDLLRGFCALHGLRLEVDHVATRTQAVRLLTFRKVHLAAGLFPVLTPNDPGIQFGPSTSMLQAQLIYRSDEMRPREVADLINKKIETASGGGGAAALSKLAQTNVDLTWQVASRGFSDRLLSLVESHALDYAVVPSIDFKVLRRKYPRLAVGFSVGPVHATAWMLSVRTHNSVYQALTTFLLESENTRSRAALWDRYYDHLDGFDFIDARALLRAYDERLPKFRDAFIASAHRSGFDWRLLAALSYQESHWDPTARSRTGVRGLMMLTTVTAKELGVSRLDPMQAIEGGTRYLENILARLPESIVGNERLWFALGAYNIGYGHMADARLITRRRGKDPNSWRDVREHLPLLANPSIAATTRYGLARGGETVHFIRRIRRYFDTIRQLEELPRVARETDSPYRSYGLRSL